MTNIGRVDFLVDFDGKKLPAKARQIGQGVGDSAGTAATERFAEKFTPFGKGAAARLSRDGRLAGFRISDAMENAIESRLSGLTQKIANAFLTPQSLNEFSKNFDSVDDAAKDLRISLQELHDTGNLNDEMWGRFGGTLNQWLGEARKSEQVSKDMDAALFDLRQELDSMEVNQSRVNDAFDKYNERIEIAEQKSRDLADGAIFDLKRELADFADHQDRVNEGFSKYNTEIDVATSKTERNSKAVDGNSFSWKSLSHNLRQAIVIVSAVAAAGEEIAVLGSAVGAGLSVVLGSALTLGTGLGVLIAGLQGVGDSLDLFNQRDEILSILPEDRTEEQIASLQKLEDQIAGLDASIPAIGRLGDSFVAMQDKIQSALLDGLGPAIDSLTDELVPTLTAGFEEIGGALNGAFEDLIARMVTPEAKEVFGQIFSDMADQLPFLIEAIGNIGAGIGGFLVAAGPSLLNFAKWFERITGQFDDFTNSVEGNQSIQEWLRNGERVLSAFGDLLGGVADTLANLVDEESVEQTIEFLDDLTASLPFLQDLIEVLGGLDLFGNIANILNEVGNALSPLLDYLKPIAEVLGESLKTNIDIIALAFNFLLVPLQLLNPLFEGLGIVISGLMQYFQDLLVAYEPLFAAFDALAIEIGEELRPAFEELLQAIIDLLPSPEELARIIENVVMPAVEEFSDWILNEGIPALLDVIKVFKDWLDGIGGIEGAAAKLDAFMTVLSSWARTFVAVLGGPISIISNLIGLISQLNGMNVETNYGGQTGGRTGGVSRDAAGGITANPHFGWTGESGPEAIVPMNRALSQVDPSVRRLSAIIQGKPYYGDDLNGGGGGGITVGEGAIQIIGVSDGRAAADMALDRFVSMAGG